MMGNTRIQIPVNPASQLSTSMSSGISSMNNINGNFVNTIRTPNVSTAQVHYVTPQHQQSLRMQGSVPISSANFNPNVRLPQQPHMFNQSVGNLQSSMPGGGFNQMDSIQIPQQQQMNYGSNPMQKIQSMPMAMPDRIQAPGSMPQCAI
jgi:hypothetical protein